MRWLILALVGLPACNVFENPPVVCPTRSPISLVQSQVQPSPNSGCIFSPITFAVSYAPRVDTVAAQNMGLGPVSDYTLIGGAVNVSAAVGAALLCPGSTLCTQSAGGASRIVATIDQMGTLSYSGTFGVQDFIGVPVMAGGSFKWDGMLATESFGPASSCDVPAHLELTCVQPQK
jgi:hypothetical protein